MRNRNRFGLTPQQERFAQEVASGETQSEAFRRAYPASRNWKAETVHERASVLAANSKVQARIAGLQNAVADLAVVKVADALREIRSICFSDIGKVMRDGKCLLPKEMDADTRAVLASFKMDEFGRIEYKFWDKNAALDKACKILGLYERDNRQKTDPLRDLLQALSGNVIGVAGGES